jgi:hypothetical protein
VIERLSVEYEIKPCCQPLGVSRSGYYQWKKQERTQRAKEEAELIQEIKEIFEANKGRYGSPRVTETLRAKGTRCGENRVAHLMKQNRLRARPKTAFRPRTTVAGSDAAAPSLIKDLEPTGMDQIWVSDITYVATAQGWLYLAVILDLFSRKVRIATLNEVQHSEIHATTQNNKFSRPFFQGKYTVPNDSSIKVKQNNRKIERADLQAPSPKKASPSAKYFWSARRGPVNKTPKIRASTHQFPPIF